MAGTNRGGPNEVRPDRGAILQSPPENSQRPQPHQLLTIGQHQIDGIRLMYPGLRQIPRLDLREALYAHRRQLAFLKLRAQGDRPISRPPHRPTAFEISRYRDFHPELHWMSAGGVAATIIFEVERVLWLREGLLVEIGAPHDDPVGRNFPQDLFLLPTPGNAAVKAVEPNFEPTDEEVQEFRAQCESLMRISPRHTRSIITYLRQRRWRRRQAAGLASVLPVRGESIERLNVPAASIRRRIVELEQAEGSNLARRANLQRIQELQRLLAVERTRRLESADRRREWVMVDRAVQTMALPISRADPRFSVEAAEDVAGEVDGVESDTDVDDGMILDGESGYSGETIESEDYHDLFEEFHGALI